MPESDARSPRSRFTRACVAGGVAALVVFIWFALEGKASPFAGEVLANFYEVQARSLLHGHWDASAGSFLFERFNINGEFHTYFGPWPALLRVPIVLFTGELDGRLSRVSMIAAFAVMLFFVARLAWQTRTLVAGDRPVTRGTLLAAGGFVFVAGCGSAALFLGSWTAVYHEAILWGIAWSVTTYSYLLTYLTEPSRRALVLTAVTATFSYLSRTSIGLGPVLALAVVLVAQCALRVRDRGGLLRLLGVPREVAARPIRPVLIATIVPVALGAYVNYARFGSLFGLPPYDRQDLLALRPHRQAALAASGGSLFGFEFVPTTLVQYLRPDAIGFDRLFPWVQFSPRPHVFGDAVFESIDFTASMTATSTLLVALAIVGVIASLKGRSGPADEPRTALLRVPIATAAVGCVGALVLAFLEERYVGDFVPVLVLAGVTGLWWTQRALTGRGRRLRVGIGALLVVLAAWSCWVTGALALQYQRGYAPAVTREARAGLVDFALSLHDLVPGGAPSRVGRGSRSELPSSSDAGDLFIVGECDGLYWSNGREWHPLEQTPRTGGFELRVRLPDVTNPSREPLVTANDARGAGTLWVRYLGADSIRLEYKWTGPPVFPETGAPTPDAKIIGQPKSDPVSVGADRTLLLSVRFDPEGYVGVRNGDIQLLSTFAPVADTTPRLARARFGGTIGTLPVATPICDALLNDL